jgi:ribosomal protein S12 methylthiotransferase
MKRFALVSLGCPKNLVDSEYICERFMEAGYTLVQESRDADLVVVNTCSFLTSAVQESIEVLLEVAGSGKKVICAGCLVSRYREDILKELPEVSLCAGPGSYDRIVQAYEAGDKYIEPAFSSVVSRSFFSGTASAYVKVSEGCSNHCHYCLIPSIRGRLISKVPEDIVEECRTLAGRGAREVVLVAQDLGSYGRDIALKDGLVRLVEKIATIDDLEWIRIMYVHPASLTRSLVQQIEENPKVCPYIDLPIQHISEPVLKAMGRRGGAMAVRRAFELIMGSSREIWVRTSLMVGHPGEDEKAFTELEDFVAKGYIHHLGAFVYSPEPGTKSATRQDIPDRRTALQRRRRIMTLQQRLSKKRLHKIKGNRIQVLIEGYHPETELLLRGRAPFQAPQIDGMVVINEGGADAGDMPEVEITGSWEYDLVGRIA